MPFTPLWMWSPERHITATLGQELEIDVGAAIVTTPAAALRHGTKSLQCTGGLTGANKSITLPSDFYVGFGAYWWVSSGSIIGLAQANQILTVLGAGGRQVCLFFGPDGTMQVATGHQNTPTYLATSAAGLFVQSSLYWIEIHAIIAAAPDGLIEVRLNEQVVYSLSGVNTRPYATAPLATRLGWYGPSTGSGVGRLNISDVVVGTGDWPGDTWVLDYLPSGAGTHAGFSVTGAATAHAALGSIDGNTSYISAAAAGTKHSTVVTPLDIAAPSKPIYGVQVDLVAATDAGAASLKPIVLHGAAEAAGAAGAINTGYLARNPGMFALNPATGAAWTAAEIATLEAGGEIA